VTGAIIKDSACLEIHDRALEGNISAAPPHLLLWLFLVTVKFGLHALA